MNDNNRILYPLPARAAALEARFGQRRALFGRDVFSSVMALFDDVAARGDEAVREATQRFDDVVMDSLVLSEAYVARCVDALDPALRAAIELAIRNVRAVNRELLPVSWEKTIRPGTIVGELVRPLDTAGIWIPSRKGPLLSTAIMLTAAAKEAGVPQIVVGMPPRPDGTGDPGTVAAAKLAGADRIVIGNGVTVIAGFTFGTASIPEADGIFGPGPGGIAAAMSAAGVFGKRTVPGLGPTECIVLADDSADPLLTAWDLANEAEHGPDSSAVLVTDSLPFAEAVERRLRGCIAEAEGERRGYLERVFGPEGRGAIVVTDNFEEACAFVNREAPEHVMINCRPDHERLALETIRHAGELLLGPSTPFSAANYGIGITAVLPTNRFARAFSGVTARDMVKVSTIGRLDAEALRAIRPLIRAFADVERLPFHARAADVRLD